MVPLAIGPGLYKGHNLHEHVSSIMSFERSQPGYHQPAPGKNLTNNVRVPGDLPGPPTILPLPHSKRTTPKQKTWGQKWTRMSLLGSKYGLCPTPTFVHTLTPTLEQVIKSNPD